MHVNRLPCAHTRCWRKVKELVEVEKVLASTVRTQGQPRREEGITVGTVQMAITVSGEYSCEFMFFACSVSCRFILAAAKYSPYPSWNLESSAMDQRGG